jgi:hypothetical protein
MRLDRFQELTFCKVIAEFWYVQFSGLHSRSSKASDDR